jgi:hypothetical protein
LIVNNDLDGRVVFDVLMNDNSGEDDNVQDFVWEDMEKYVE